MITTSDEAHETRLRSQGYSSAFIRPLWYRIYRLLGVRVPLPVQMSLPEHLFFGGVQALAVLAAASGTALALGYVSRFPLALVLALTLILPLMNWIRYRNARRHIAPPGHSPGRS